MYSNGQNRVGAFLSERSVPWRVGDQKNKMGAARNYNRLLHIFLI